ncbi:MAG TPA: hypothetical protein ENJ44_00425 [Oceanospirillales bacterium]|nr:hypothetical protein [Oceanospirillales bacterium]
MDLQNSLPEIFSPQWQKKLVAEIVEQIQTKRFKNYFGHNFHTIEQFKHWLKNYEKKEAVINYLQSF